MDDVQIRVAGQTLHLDKGQLAATLWEIVPDAIKNPESADAKKFQAIRLGLKGFIRPYIGKFIPAIFAKLERPAPELPRAKDGDLLQWLSKVLVDVLVEEVGKRKWGVILEPIDAEHWHVVGFHAIANQVASEGGTGTTAEG